MIVKRYPDLHFYKIIGDKWNNWDMKLHENHPRKNKQELMEREH